MCSLWPQQLFGFRKVLTFLCTILTLLLIYQELVAFTITRPTSNFQEEKKLETMDIPEVVLCFEPGFDSKVLSRYGYNIDTYYRGAKSKRGSFVGWNGDKNKTKTSKDILEEVLVVDSQILNKRNSFLRAWFTEDHVDVVPAEIKLRTLAYPFEHPLHRF